MPMFAMDVGVDESLDDLLNDTLTRTQAYIIL